MLDHVLQDNPIELTLQYQPEALMKHWQSEVQETEKYTPSLDPDMDITQIFSQGAAGKLL
jgi:hypothetical protein